MILFEFFIALICGVILIFAVVIHMYVSLFIELIKHLLSNIKRKISIFNKDKV